MTLLNRILYIVQTMRPFWNYVLNYIFALCFLATVPFIIDHIFRR